MSGDFFVFSAFPISDSLNLGPHEAMSSDLYTECILYNEVLKRNPKSLKGMFSDAKISEIKKFVSASDFS